MLVSLRADNYDKLRIVTEDCEKAARSAYR